MSMLFNQALSIPVSSFTLPRLTIRGEVNPVSEKFATIGDPDMPGLPNFSVLSKDNLSHWEPDSLIMITTRFIPGQSLASFPLEGDRCEYCTAQRFAACLPDAFEREARNLVGVRSLHLCMQSLLSL